MKTQTNEEHVACSGSQAFPLFCTIFSTEAKQRVCFYQNCCEFTHFSDRFTHSECRAKVHPTNGRYRLHPKRDLTVLGHPPNNFCLFFSNPPKSTTVTLYLALLSCDVLIGQIMNAYPAFWAVALHFSSIFVSTCDRNFLLQKIPVYRYTKFTCALYLPSSDIHQSGPRETPKTTPTSYDKLTASLKTLFSDYLSNLQKNPPKINPLLC